MSLLRSSTSNTLRAVGAGVGKYDRDGAIDSVGGTEGTIDILGIALGSFVGSVDIDGVMVGNKEVDGRNDGDSDGRLVGIAD